MFGLQFAACRRCFLSSEPVYNVIVTLVVPVVFVVAVVAVAFARTARNVILDNEARPDLDEEGEADWIEWCAEEKDQKGLGKGDYRK